MKLAKDKWFLPVTRKYIILCDCGMSLHSQEKVKVIKCPHCGLTTHVAWIKPKE